LHEDAGVEFAECVVDGWVVHGWFLYKVDDVAAYRAADGGSSLRLWSLRATAAVIAATVQLGGAPGGSAIQANA